VSLRIADPGLADRIRTVLEAVPGADLAAEDEAGIGIVDAAPEDGESGLIVLAEGADALRALRAGADAVLPPDASGEELRLAIEAVARGFALLPADLLGRLAGHEDGEGGAGDTPAALTPREGEVLALLAAGASNKAIARRLGISVHTAKFHVASILDKLDATGRTDAVARGVRLGLLML